MLQQTTLSCSGAPDYNTFRAAPCYDKRHFELLRPTTLWEMLVLRQNDTLTAAPVLWPTALWRLLWCSGRRHIKSCSVLQPTTLWAAPVLGPTTLKCALWSSTGSFHAKSTSTIHHTISDCLVIFFLDSIHRDILLLFFAEFCLTNWPIYDFLKFCAVMAILQKWADSRSLKRNNFRTNRARGLKFFCVYTTFCVLLEYGVVTAVSHLDVAQ